MLASNAKQQFTLSQGWQYKPTVLFRVILHLTCKMQVRLDHPALKMQAKKSYPPCISSGLQVEPLFFLISFDKNLVRPWTITYEVRARLLSPHFKVGWVNLPHFANQVQSKPKRGQTHIATSDRFSEIILGCQNGSAYFFVMYETY